MEVKTVIGNENLIDQVKDFEEGEKVTYEEISDCKQESKNTIDFKTYSWRGMALTKYRSKLN